MKIFAMSDIHGSRKNMDKLNTVASDIYPTLVCGDIGGKDGRGKPSGNSPSIGSKIPIICPLV